MKWAIVSWQQSDFQVERFGKLLAMVEGTEEKAREEARIYIPNFSPVSICVILEGK